jgi:hypothetical protein
VSLAQHLAEKLHAYCAVYADGQQNTRIKDLVDIVLILTVYDLGAAEMGDQMQRTFEGRQGHQLSSRFPAPPELWRPGYQAMAGGIGLDPDIAAGYQVAAAFFDPLLAGEVVGDASWSSNALRWIEKPRGFAGGSTSGTTR